MLVALIDRYKVNRLPTDILLAMKV
jgi:hypothetical protein